MAARPRARRQPGGGDRRHFACPAGHALPGQRVDPPRGASPAFTRASTSMVLISYMRRNNCRPASPSASRSRRRYGGSGEPGGRWATIASASDPVAAGSYKSGAPSPVIRSRRSRCRKSSPTSRKSDGREPAGLRVQSIGRQDASRGSGLRSRNHSQGKQWVMTQARIPFSTLVGTAQGRPTVQSRIALRLPGNGRRPRIASVSWP